MSLQSVNCLGMARFRTILPSI